VLVSARRCSGGRGRTAQSGALLIEVLIAVLI